jgi:hypothetical protein
MKRILLFLACILAASSILSMEIRNIVPPNLSEVHLGKKILCHRPMRSGTPKMAIKKIDDKVIAHNYGHGGSGWTLGPGSAAYVNSLLEKSEHSLELNKSSHITIIGAGALGLFTAYDLYQRGYKNITIVAESFEGLTSHNAGGLLAPVSMDNKPKKQMTIDKIGVDAYKFYAAIAKKNHAHFQGGAVIIPTYFENREDSGLEPYVKQNVMTKAKDVILDFGNATQRPMVSYDDGIFIDTAKMMDGLASYLKEHVEFVQKRINNFSEIDDKYIINCTGLGSKGLNNDEALVSVQGHLIMLKDQNPGDLQHMILVYFGKYTNKLEQTVQRSFYMFPKKLAGTAENDIGVIGGTFIEGATSETPNEEEFDIMIEGAREFYGLH